MFPTNFLCHQTTDRKNLLAWLQNLLALVYGTLLSTVGMFAQKYILHKATLGTVYNSESIIKFYWDVNTRLEMWLSVSKILCFILKIIKDIEDVVEVEVAVEAEVEAPGEEEEVVVQEMWVIVGRYK